jgi:hypothetical protein
MEEKEHHKKSKKSSGGKLRKQKTSFGRIAGGFFLAISD